MILKSPAWTLPRLAILTALLMMACAGCQSEQEEKGVSALPQNRPAKWEQSRGIGGPLK